MEFKTKDFSTIVLLKYHRVPIIKISEIGRIKTIHVEKTADVEQLLLDYENDRITVSMRTLMQTINDTKALVHR